MQPNAAQVDILLNDIGTLIKSEQYREVFNLIKNEKFSDCLLEDSWKVVDYLAEFLTDSTAVDNNKLFECCNQCLMYIANHSCQPDGFFEMLERIEVAKTDVHYLLFFKLSLITYPRITLKNELCIMWLLNSLSVYMLTFKKDCGVFDSASYNENRFFALYKPIIDYIESVYVTVEETDHKNEILSFLFNLLGLLFPYFNLDLEQVPTTIHTLGKQIALIMLNIKKDPFWFCTQLIREQPPNMMLVSGDNRLHVVNPSLRLKISPEGLGMLMFYVFTPLLNVSYPQVYSENYKYFCKIKLADLLIATKDRFAIKKGLYLMDHAVDNRDSLTIQDLWHPNLRQLLPRISEAMIFSGQKADRRRSFLSFEHMMKKFDDMGLYWLLYHFKKYHNMDTTLAFFITFIKSKLLELIESNRKSYYFHGKMLHDILKLFCSFPYKRTSAEDLEFLSNKNAILASLNLFRFFVQRDKTDQLGMKEYLGDVYEYLIENVEKHIKSFRLLSCRSLETGRLPQSMIEGMKNMSLSDSKVSMQAPTVEEQVETIKIWILTCDMVQDVLIRVKEVLKEAIGDLLYELD